MYLIKYILSQSLENILENSLGDLKRFQEDTQKKSWFLLVSLEKMCIGYSYT